MITRYSRKELTNIWSEENKYKIWLDVEIAAAQAMEKYKIIPKGVASIVKKKGKINVRLSKKQLSARRKKWKPKKINFGSGTLWKYAQTVGPAYLGASTHPGKKKEVKTYADI